MFKKALLIMVVMVSIGYGIDTVTIPKENYDNIRHLVSRLNIRCESTACANMKLVKLEDVKPIAEDLRKQIDRTWDYCRPLNAEEKVSLMQNTLDKQNRRIELLEECLKRFMPTDTKKRLDALKKGL